ncbi:MULTISPECIES: TetR/AcrR family transcriptional regulator [Terrabacteria group]|uniref:TetR/AcrR family transcriptional regulator n=1 Tax=Bacillati TaxID=1783272 RepID=UPI00193AB8DE|nr:MULTISPECIES: TetR/AcrR family transcriptional regulator [Terrabacteria group]MBW9212048.1 TetR/AcrR family transcriptional regulator [Trueperella sp. zg.1013]QRG87145.1 TetR/AcrR family transcriptional regulator [Bulleidia sp. zg-1006]
MSNLTLNQVVRESITEALFRLMHNKDFEKIKIKEITDLAGVGRVSFYRNFDSKKEVVIQQLNAVTKQWCLLHQDELQRLKDYLPLLEELKPILVLLKSSNGTDLLYDYLYEALLPQMDTEKRAYLLEMQVGMFFGIMKHWIRNDFKESQEQLNHFLACLDQCNFPEK